jgi:hypothetical protein
VESCAGEIATASRVYLTLVTLCQRQGKAQRASPASHTQYQALFLGKKEMPERTWAMFGHRKNAVLRVRSFNSRWLPFTVEGNAVKNSKLIFFVPFAKIRCTRKLFPSVLAEGRFD